MRSYFRVVAACLLFIFLFICQVSFLARAQTENQVIESLDFREVDIKDVLRQLAKQYNLNIIFSQAVSGSITVQLSNVSLEEALDSIITVNGFAYSKKGNIIKVSTAEEAQRAGKQSKLFKLNNADASGLKTTLNKVLSADGSIEIDTRSNAILVTDTLAVINKIEAMVPSLDELTPQVLIEAKLIETTLTKNDKLGIDWSTTIAAVGSARPTTLPFTGIATAKFFPKVAVPDSMTSSTDSSGTVTESTLHRLGAGFPDVSTDLFKFGTLDFTGLKAVFDFLKSRSNTRLVANPRIVTLNNKKATINVGEVLSLPKYERNTTTGIMEITGWDQYPIGVILEVTPQVSPDGHIKLKLKPNVSNLLGYASNRNGVNEGPITSTRTAETEVQIRDGQTVVIGGLVKDESLVVVNKIPILGDIPILGLLFTRKSVGSTGNPNTKSDLLIFVTASIIKDTNQPLIAYGSKIISEPVRQLKLDTRQIERPLKLERREIK